MVPGSTLMYGSSFCIDTLRPWRSSSQPMAAEVSPLPSEDTTPPVTNTYLVMVVPCVRNLPSPPGPQARQERIVVRARLDSPWIAAGVEDLDAHAVLQEAQLLQGLGLVEPAARQVRD